MTHLGEGTLQELLDGELPPGARAEAEAHLASCPACAGELAELRGLTARTSALLGLVEATPPVLAAQARFARHRRGGGALNEARRALPRAAVLVLALAGAAAAAAIPGSPAREWVRSLGLSERAEQPAVPVQPAPEAVPAAPAEMAPKAVSILPSEGRVRIAVSASSPELRVRARLVPGGKAEVTATGAAATARFRTGPGRIEVLGAGPGELVITLPADADAAFVEVNGRVLAAKEGAQLRSLAPRVAGSAAEPVFRAGS
ncbi:MAG TPA: zf-HC2 domain-containing protein [Longimicrobium sp.]|nr:zf-HC2 domain-containing protein [Longimicrobium sp.]